MKKLSKKEKLRRIEQNRKAQTPDSELTLMKARARNVYGVVFRGRRLNTGRFDY